MHRSKYTIVDERGREGLPTYDLSKNREYLIAWVSQDLSRQTDICIYGNPAGLRHLARLLLRVADLDQTKDTSTPANSCFHCHVSTGLNTEARGGLPRLTLGRVDSKKDPKELRDSFPPLVPRFCNKSILDPRDLPGESKWNP